MQPSLRKLNNTLTKWVINLHQCGYTNDFWTIDKEHIQCAQTGESFSLAGLRICLVDCEYDLLTKTYQYIHTIDTYDGYRGLLITNGILPLNIKMVN